MVKKLFCTLYVFLLCVVCCGCRPEIINVEYETLKDRVQNIEIVRIVWGGEAGTKLECIEELSEEEEKTLLKDLENIDFYVVIYGDPLFPNDNELAIKINFSQEDYYLITQYSIENVGKNDDNIKRYNPINPYHKETNSYYDINALINKYLTNEDGGDL